MRPLLGYHEHPVGQPKDEKQVQKSSNQFGMITAGWIAKIMQYACMKGVNQKKNSFRLSENLTPKFL